MLTHVEQERDPSFTPGTGANTSCSSNPPSTTFIKCSVYGGLLTAASATNTGQWQGNFQLVIAGSNIYQQAVQVAPTGFTGPQIMGNVTINSPSGYMGVQTFAQNTVYDPSICAAACSAKSTFDVAQGLPTKAKPDICNFFVAYMLYKNGQSGVFTCTFYTSQWGMGYATNVGQWDSAGNHYTIGNSNGFAVPNAPQNGAV